MPKISVIVPIYNVEAYLSRCIDSILAQTFTDFELILVDDGSPDNCPAICDEYARKDCRVKVLHKKNEGVSVARNTGLDAAVGEYVTFVDSDDYIDSEHLEMLYKYMIQEKGDMVVSTFTIVDETEHPQHNIVRQALGNFETLTKENKEEYIFRYFLTHAHGWEIWTRLFKRQIIAEHNLRFPTGCGDYAEDLGFVLVYILYAGRITSISCGGYNYRMRTGSMMRNSESIIKVNNLNELSKWIYPFYCDIFKKGENFALLHFLLLHTEYGKVIHESDAYARLGEYLKTVQDYEWFNKQLANLKRCKRGMEHYFGRRIRCQIGLFTHYCSHRNWKRYTYESAVAYRWFIPKE